MNELIKITEENGKQLVSARELHEFLEVGKTFTAWADDRIEKYGFEENVDFTVFWSDSKNGNAVEFLGSPQKMSAKGYMKDYIVSIDMAKELSMVENNDKGKEARKYFIEMEKKARVPKSYAEALLEAGRIQLELEKKQALLEEKNRTISILTHVNKLYTTTEIAKELGFKSAIQFNKKLCEDGIQYKQNETYFI